MKKKLIVLISFILAIILILLSSNYIFADNSSENDSKTVQDSIEKKETAEITEETKRVESKSIEQEKVIEDGLYKIYSTTADNRLIESPDRKRDKKTYFKLGKDEDLASQKFQITYNKSDNTYTLKLLSSLKEILMVHTLLDLK